MAGNATVALPAAQAAHVLVVPITGAMRAGRGPTAAASALVEVAKIGLLAVPAGGTRHFTNPHANALITFLHIWLAAEAGQRAPPASASLSTPPALPTGWPRWCPPPARRPFRASLGRFTGQAEAVYCLHSSTARFFTFVLAGAFEVEGRLLHAHDWGTRRKWS